MTVGEVLRRANDHLAAKGSETPRLDAELLLAHALGRQRIELYTDFDRPLDTTELAGFRELISRRSRREPVAYILGERGFRRLMLKVDRRALIPRPETETVVERCLERLRGLDAPEVLDVGTGSGAIALALVDEHAGVAVTAIDVSPEAVALARENAHAAGAEIAFIEHDLHTGLPAGPFDLVVSNPPYVAAEELATLMPDVRDYEPHVALVGEGVTEVVATGARAVLRRGGWLVLEVGDGQAQATMGALERLGFLDCRITQDLARRERVVEGRWQEPVDHVG
jgi:release factor glutamine methyltransferase